MTSEISIGSFLDYDKVGNGRTVVLLHAFPLCNAMWRHQAAAISSSHQVLMPNYRGFGESSPFKQEPSIDRLADDVASLLDSLKIATPVVLGGLSMGGYVALAVARKYPERLRALILADTRGEPDDEPAKAGRDKLIDSMRTQSARELIDQLLPKLLSAETRANRPDIVEEVRRMAAVQTPEAIIAALKVLRNRPDASPTLANIRIPTLVLVGSEDSLTPPTMAEALANAIAGARIARIPGAGHLSNLEQPELFNAALREFLDSLES